MSFLCEALCACDYFVVKNFELVDLERLHLKLVLQVGDIEKAASSKTGQATGPFQTGRFDQAVQWSFIFI